MVCRNADRLTHTSPRPWGGQSANATLGPPYSQGDIIAAAQPLEVHRLLAGMLGMGRVTYLILPCDSHESGMP